MKAQTLIKWRMENDPAAMPAPGRAPAETAPRPQIDSDGMDEGRQR